MRSKFYLLVSWKKPTALRGPSCSYFISGLLKLPEAHRLGYPPFSFAFPAASRFSEAAGASLAMISGDKGAYSSTFYTALPRRTVFLSPLARQSWPMRDKTAQVLSENDNI